MTDELKFKTFFSEMGVVANWYPLDEYNLPLMATNDFKKKYKQTTIIQVAQALFHFSEAGEYLGVEADETNTFDRKAVI